MLCRPLARYALTAFTASQLIDPSLPSHLGVMHGTGRGVLKDDVLAHMWLNIAGVNGNEIARKRRNTLERRDMTRAEISRATELARECMDSDYQDCAP